MMKHPITIKHALPEDKLGGILDNLKDNWRLDAFSRNKSDTPFWTTTKWKEKDLIYWDAGLYLKFKLQKHLRASLEMIRFKANLSTAAMEGSSFHIDTSETDCITAIVYASPSWNVQWGGETVVFDGNKYHYGTYIPNNCYVLPSHWEHYGASPNVRAKEPRITLAFMYRVCYNYPITTH